MTVAIDESSKTNQRAEFSKANALMVRWKASCTADNPVGDETLIAEIWNIAAIQNSLFQKAIKRNINSEDVYEASLLAFWEAAKSWQADKGRVFSTWLYAIAERRLIDYWKNNHPDEEIAFSLNDVIGEEDETFAELIHDELAVISRDEVETEENVVILRKMLEAAISELKPTAIMRKILEAVLKLGGDVAGRKDQLFEQSKIVKETGLSQKQVDNALMLIKPFLLSNAGRWREQVISELGKKTAIKPERGGITIAELKSLRQKYELAKVIQLTGIPKDSIYYRFRASAKGKTVKSRISDQTLLASYRANPDLKFLERSLKVCEVTLYQRLEKLGVQFRVKRKFDLDADLLWRTLAEVGSKNGVAKKLNINSGTVKRFFNSTTTRPSEADLPKICEDVFQFFLKSGRDDQRETLRKLVQPLADKIASQDFYLIFADEISDPSPNFYQRLKTRIEPEFSNRFERTVNPIQLFPPVVWLIATEPQPLFEPVVWAGSC